jgi:ribosome-binding protein aMBF1 (putative translation factor)
VNDSGTAARLIRTARRSAGISQTALALRAGEPQSVISAYERGRRQPSAMALSRLIEAAGFRLIIVPAPQPSPDVRRASAELSEALTLAEALPRRRRPPRLDYPRLPS